MRGYRPENSETGETMNGVDPYALLGMLIVIGLATGVLTGLTGASGMSILISALLSFGSRTLTC